jgi:hypothetical protein
MQPHHILLGLLFAVVFAVTLGLAVSAPGSRKAFARDKDKFVSGKGRDPEKRWVGPHMPYITNVLYFLVVFLPIMLVIFWFYPPPI